MADWRNRPYPGLAGLDDSLNSSTGFSCTAFKAVSSASSETSNNEQTCAPIRCCWTENSASCIVTLRMVSLWPLCFSRFLLRVSLGYPRTRSTGTDEFLWLFARLRQLRLGYKKSASSGGTGCGLMLCLAANKIQLCRTPFPSSVQHKDIPFSPKFLHFVHNFFHL